MTQARDLADGKFDTSTLVVDAANNRVGLGTTTPATRLHLMMSGSANSVQRIQAGVNGYAAQLHLYGQNAGGSSYNAVKSFVNGDSTPQWEITGPEASAEDVMTLHTGGSERVRIDNSGNVGIGTTGPTHKLHVIGDVQAENSSGHRALIVKGNSTTNYEGGSLLLANAGMATNYGGTYLYHHKAGGSGTTNASFNISQRTAGGAYVSNVWNVDYQNSVQSFYVPNGGISGASALTINANGTVSMPKQAYIILQGNNGNNITWNQNDLIGSTDYGTTAWNNTGSENISYNTANGRLTPNTAGVYAIHLCTYFNSTQTNVRVAILKNGGNIAMSHNNAQIYGTLHVNMITYLNGSSDYITFAHQSGGDRTFYEGANHTYAYMYKLN